MSCLILVGLSFVVQSFIDQISLQGTVTVSQTGTVVVLVVRPLVFITVTSIGIHERALKTVVFRSEVNDGIVVSVCQIEGAIHAADCLERCSIGSAA